ncbi:subunit length determinant protein [Stackebrandtia albiflava]|uniref:Subunit length determinant protein n=1 Tax=Stackebrandtia albiflava TaxID=406432 RepID=A0A562V3W2_9ACTN|nr:Wzz/FepE/Etk N-terminal domain-containing protein [Stackebrandtia albiflava]TWJ12589.1 subunit length determinant protein [Stackebrandtia albiflava]
MTAAPVPGRTLGDYVDVLKRHRWLLIGATVVGLACGAGYSALAPKKYEAVTSVLVQPTGAEEGSLAQGRTRGEINLDTEAQLVKSTEVAVLAATRLGEGAAEPAELSRQVRVTVPPNTSILDITFVASEPRAARAGAQAFATAYLEHRATSAYTRLSEQAGATATELTELRGQRDELSAAMDELKPTSSRYAALKNDRDILDNEIADLTARNSRLRTAAESVGSGKIISEADVPSTAASPHRLVNMAGGATIGLLAALLVMAVRMRFAVRIWHPGDVTRRCDVEVLTTLPGRLRIKPTDVFGAFGPVGRVFGKLRHEVAAAMGDTTRVIVVAGVAPGSASSVVSANLAAALARAGDPVVAVASHPGGPVTLPSQLGVPAVPGLSDVFADRARLTAALHPAARQPLLHVIGPGGCATATGPTGDMVSEVYARLKDRADWVVVDAAPLSISADAQFMAGPADAVILAVECGRDRVDEVLDAVQAVHRIGVPLLGAVVLPRSSVPTEAPLTVPRHEDQSRRQGARRPAPRPRPRDVMPSPDDTPTETMPVVDAQGAPAGSGTADDH